MPTCTFCWTPAHLSLDIATDCEIIGSVLTNILTSCSMLIIIIFSPFLSTNLNNRTHTHFQLLWTEKYYWIKSRVTRYKQPCIHRQNPCINQAIYVLLMHGCCTLHNYMHSRPSQKQGFFSGPKFV